MESVPRSIRGEARYRFAAVVDPAMERSLLMLSPSYEGWKLMDDGKPVLWFPEKAAALEVANLIAEARHAFSDRPTGVEVEDEDRLPKRVASYG
jgi:hypothetical protein